MGFDPVTAAVVLGVAGLATSTAGMIQQGSAASANARYQAQVARNNAIIADRNATQARAAGEQQAMTQSMKGGAQLARIKVAQAASGVDVNSGSALDVQVGEAETGELDTLTVMHNALLKSYGYEAEAGNERGQAGLDEATASNAMTGALLGAGGSLLGGASSIGFKWSGMQGNGGATSIPEWDGYGIDD